jgi:hypothetical protein
MGQEIECVVTRGKEKHSGKALLETNEIIFRGPTLRLKVPFAKMKGLVAKDGELRLEAAEGKLAFAIGEAAEKWREKILHPKTRIEKLGVKAGERVELLGKFESEFVKEIGERADRGAGHANWIFLAIEEKKNLSEVVKASKKLRGAAGLWIVYPKGRKEVTELDVISAGRKAGLKDVKVVGFSQTHTALKFVISVDKR